MTTILIDKRIYFTPAEELSGTPKEAMLKTKPGKIFSVMEAHARNTH